MYTHKQQPDAEDHQEPHKPRLTYLALGDSYTVGEGVPSAQSFPFQLMKELKRSGLDFLPPKILAKTGWTAGELTEGIGTARVGGEKYDLVTLLIGVNNQYRGLGLRNFQEEYPALLDMAVDFSKNGAENVILISIPDWGVTPFAKSKTQSSSEISLEIDSFNRYIREAANHRNTTFLDITKEYRKIGGLSRHLVEDQLHPSGSVYHLWAKSLKNLIVSGMKFQAFPS